MRKPPPRRRPNAEVRVGDVTVRATHAYTGHPVFERDRLRKLVPTLHAEWMDYDGRRWALRVFEPYTATVGRVFAYPEHHTWLYRPAPGTAGGRTIVEPWSVMAEHDVPEAVRDTLRAGVVGAKMAGLQP